MTTAQPFLLNSSNVEFLAGRSPTAARTPGLGWFGVVFLAPFVLIGLFLVGQALQE